MASIQILFRFSFPSSLPQIDSRARVSLCMRGGEGVPPTRFAVEIRLDTLRVQDRYYEIIDFYRQEWSYPASRTPFKKRKKKSFISCKFSLLGFLNFFNVSKDFMATPKTLKIENDSPRGTRNWSFLTSSSILPFLLLLLRICLCLCLRLLLPPPTSSCLLLPPPASVKWIKFVESQSCTSLESSLPQLNRMLISVSGIEDWIRSCCDVAIGLAREGHRRRWIPIPA